MIDPRLIEDELRDDESNDFRDDVEEWEEDPAFDHLRDEERNFIAEEREKENEY